MRTFSGLLTLTALLGLALMLALPPDPLGLATSAPLVLAILAALAQLPRWSLAAAVLLLPYFSYGVMEVLTNPADRTRAVFFSVLAVIGFFSAIDRLRRS